VKWLTRKCGLNDESLGDMRSRACSGCARNVDWSEACVGSFSLGTGETGLVAADALRGVVEVLILGDVMGLIGECALFEGERGLRDDNPNEIRLGRSSGLRDREGLIEVEDDPLDELRWCE
jgi:hypothetical protein